MYIKLESRNMKTINATSARTNLFQLLKNTLNQNLPTRITTKHGAVVLMSEEEYDGWMETMQLLSIPGFKESFDEAEEEIKRGEVYTAEEVFKDLRNEI